MRKRNTHRGAKRPTKQFFEFTAQRVPGWHSHYSAPRNTSNTPTLRQLGTPCENEPRPMHNPKISIRVPFKEKTVRISLISRNKKYFWFRRSMSTKQSRKTAKRKQRKVLLRMKGKWTGKSPQRTPSKLTIPKHENVGEYLHKGGYFNIFYRSTRTPDGKPVTSGKKKLYEVRAILGPTSLMPLCCRPTSSKATPARCSAGCFRSRR